MKEGRARSPVARLPPAPQTGDPQNGLRCQLAICWAPVVQARPMWPKYQLRREEARLRASCVPCHRLPWGLTFLTQLDGKAGCFCVGGSESPVTGGVSASRWSQGDASLLFPREGWSPPWPCGASASDGGCRDCSRQQVLRVGDDSDRRGPWCWATWPRISSGDPRGLISYQGSGFLLLSLAGSRKAPHRRATPLPPACVANPHSFHMEP